eukprot:CAMPEP_0115835372 /NCGR_PEP_ID=MMETSP0287-20121206/4160_1 /TAXON_ID=412157 /ORGANISM="Chrysochromulina rotalis, Strain UIO044" /LENGTH=422 /DNA_ID=CAMNT_0003288827 /DNA_START=62 /DNA_END=1330 /DNA_ORIENTATION=-
MASTVPKWIMLRQPSSAGCLHSQVLRIPSEEAQCHLEATFSSTLSPIAARQFPSEALPSGNNLSLHEAFGRSRLRLAYFGAHSLSQDMPLAWNRPATLDYYSKTATELNMRHDVCWAALSNAPSTNRAGQCSCLRPQPDAVIIGWTAWEAPQKAFNCLIEHTWHAPRPPVIAILNKEYAHLSRKEALIRSLAPDLVLSVLDEHQTKQLTLATQISHKRWPFAADCTTFAAAGHLEYDFDVGFTGIVRMEQTNDWRSKISTRLGELRRTKGLRIFLNVGNYSVDHGFSNSYRELSKAEYVRKMQRTKIWISTTGPSDIVGTRFFEVLATGSTLLLCNQMPTGIYKDIVSDGVQAVMFNSLDEFSDRILHYLEHEDERLQVVSRAKEHICAQHTYKNRIDELQQHLVHSVLRRRHGTVTVSSVS